MFYVTLRSLLYIKKNVIYEISYKNNAKKYLCDKGCDVTYKKYNEKCYNDRTIFLQFSYYVTLKYFKCKNCDVNVKII